MDRQTVRKMFWIGGLAAGALLVVLGAIWIWQGASARSEVHDTISREQITGTPDMSPATFKGEVAGIDTPTCDVAGKEIDTGAEARCFAEYMRIHALEATGGLTYAQMGRFQSAANPSDQKGTNDETAAAKDSTGQPVANAARNIWVTETALTTALNTSYMAEQISIFGMVVGIALIVTGIGLIVLAYAVFARTGREAAPAT